MQGYEYLVLRYGYECFTFTHQKLLWAQLLKGEGISYAKVEVGGSKYFTVWDCLNKNILLKGPIKIYGVNRAGFIGNGARTI